MGTARGVVKKAIEAGVPVARVRMINPSEAGITFQASRQVEIWLYPGDCFAVVKLAPGDDRKVVSVRRHPIHNVGFYELVSEPLMG